MRYALTAFIVCGLLAIARPASAQCDVHIERPDGTVDYKDNSFCDAVQYEPGDRFGQYPAYWYVYVLLQSYDDTEGITYACKPSKFVLRFVVFQDRTLPTLYEYHDGNDWLFLAGVAFLVDGRRIIPGPDENFTPVRRVKTYGGVHEEQANTISISFLEELAAAKEIWVRFVGETQNCDMRLPARAQAALAALALKDTADRSTHK